MIELLTPEQVAEIRDTPEFLRRQADEWWPRDLGLAVVLRSAAGALSMALNDRQAIADQLDAMEADLREVAHEDNNHALLGAANGIRALVTAIRGNQGNSK